MTLRNKDRKSNKPILITNKTETTAPKVTTEERFCGWVVNALVKKIRNEELEGRTHTVVPMVMVVEGILNGSGGPILYPADELSKVPEAWNQKPVVLGHPKGRTACTKAEINNRKIGVIMNAEFDDLGRLTAEAWIDPERCKLLDKRVWNNIQQKKMMELSTGLFCDCDMTEGEWEGKKYIAIARNHRPDHLAILTEGVGASSIKDGAGFIRNELMAGVQILDPEDRELIFAQFQKFLKNQKDSKGVVGKLLANELSYETTRNLLYAALESKYPTKDGYGYPWIEAVYDNYFIYGLGSGLWKCSYTASDSKVILSGEPQKVVRVTEYRTNKAPNKTGLAEPSSTKPNKDNNIMNKAQIITDLIKNHGYDEEDREMLEAMDEVALQRIQTKSTATKNKSAADARKEAQPSKGTKTKGGKPVKNEDDSEEEESDDEDGETEQPTKKKNVASSLSNEEQEALAYGKRVLNENKSKLVSKIKAAPGCKYTDVQLQNKTIEDLEAIASLIPAPVTNESNFEGNGEPVAQNNSFKPTDALPLPKMEFSKKSK